MKKPLLYVGSVFVFILAAVAFIFVPARSGNNQAGSAVVFGKYDGKPIEYKPNSELALNIDRYERMAKQQGQAIEGFTWFYIYTYAFRDTIGEIARKAMVRLTGYEPSNKAVARATLALPYFLDENGKYSPQLYERLSDENKADLSKSIHESLIIQRFNEDFLGSTKTLGEKKLYGLKTTDKESKFLLSIGANRRSFDLVAFDKADYPESELRRFAQENLSLFEKFDLSAISFEDEATAKKIAGQISGNALEFSDALAQDYAQKYYTDSNGKITASYRYQIKGILANESSLDSLDSLAEGAWSEVVQTSKGWTLFRKDGKTIPPDFGDADSIDFSAITFDSQDLASDVQAKLLSGELTLSDALNGAGKKTYTDDVGKLNAKTIDEAKALIVDGAEKIDNLTIGVWTAPIRTNDGWTLFRKDSNPATDAFDVVKRYVTSNESTRIEDYFIEQIKDFTSTAMLSGFDEAKSTFPLAKTHNIQNVALNYGGTSIASKLPEDVKPLSSATTNENFWEKAFSLKVGEYSAPIVLGNYVIALKLLSEETIEADDSQLAAIQNDVKGYDSESIDSAILNSKKVEDNVWDAYARLHMQ